MTTAFIIISLILIFIIGLRTLIIRYNSLNESYEFANEYRRKFIDLSNYYFKTYDSWNRRGQIDSDLYMWLTKNVNRIQADLGYLGIMHFVAPFQIYQISNYQIVINTIPKFRSGEVKDFDVDSADDCLLRYIGALEQIINRLKKKIRNPLIWFKEGFQQIVSLPLYILNWFGILEDRTIRKVVTNYFFKMLSGIGGIVAFVSALVTIIQGKEAVLFYIKQLLHR
jgi:hypothetical protein